MWIFTPTAFVSIVAHRRNPHVLLVRARLKGDLERLFPGCKVVETRRADYRFRAEIARERVAQVVADQLLGVEYDNVKDAIPRRGEVHQLRSRSMHRVWGVMHDAQVDQLPVRITHPDML